MKKMDNSGFTLIELIATIVLLVIVMSIGVFSISAIIKNAKEKNYSLLIKEIKTSVELYYQECKYVYNECNSEITLGDLVEKGYLTGNAENKNKDLGLVNTKDNNGIIDCVIKYKYTDGIIVVESSGQNSTNSCPTTGDYANN